MFAKVIVLGIVFGPIIYLILTAIGDSIEDNAREAKRKKYYGKEEIINASTYKSDITYEDIMSFFLSQIKSYKSVYYVIKYKVYQEQDKQNYAWSVITNKDVHGWGEVYNINFYFSNGWFCFSTSNVQFISGGKHSYKYYLYGHDLGSYDINKTLESCRQEAIMTYKKHGKEPNNNLPFNYIPVSMPNNSSNYSKKKSSGKQKQKSSYNENYSNGSSSDLLSFYRNLLGLKLNFNQVELKDAYRKAVAKYHPDKYGNSDPRNLENAEMLMKQVNEAYECLKKAA